ncbi:hypothetical protein B0H16DRAFT_1539780 [Mycena metata]|uniref:F-box domain-containing protein n=1 Tax=Mycena metata TaxID=1033252 RepID=A0AAD7J356_9AGAR|nr:hypothetical protein B0H16DRAFT_1539780 [Mycena metata]
METIPRKPRFLDLVEDVLILILSSCDIAAVLAVGQTNKYLNRLASTRYLWFILVKQLVQRNFIDSHPHGDAYLEGLTTQQLIEQVKRIAHGPKCWTDPNPQTENFLRRTVNRVRQTIVPTQLSPRPSALVKSQQIELHPEIGTPFGPFPGRNRTRLLPGGKYVLYLNEGRLECWSVFEDRIIWRHVCSMEQTTVLEFDTEMLEGDRAVVATCQRTWSQPQLNYIELSTLDFKSGVSDLALVSRALDSSFHTPYTECTVCGDFVAVKFVTMLRKVLLINWRTRTRVMISIYDIVALIPSYLVFTTSYASGEHVLAASPLSSIPLWEPVTEDPPSSDVSAEDIPLRHAEVLSLQGPPIWPERPLWVFQNPLQDGLFRVWLYARVQDSQLLYHYTLKVRTPVSWRLVSLTLLPSTIYAVAAMSFSGHTLGRKESYRELQIIPPVSRKDAARNRDVDDFEIFSLSLSRYSGALSYSTRQDIVIVYYD